MPKHSNEKLRPQYKRLAEMIYWDKDDIPRWKISPANCISIGDEAGTIMKRGGYRRIKSKGYGILAHRLRQYMITGELPPEEVNHINFNTDNNSSSNLVNSTSSENCLHKKKYKKNATSKYLGVHWNSKLSKWGSQATYPKNNKVWLGTYSSEEEAGKARDQFYDSKGITNFVRNFPK